MRHTVVKLLITHDGEKVEKQKWHLAVTDCGDNNTLCTGEFYGCGAGIEEYKTKEVERGGVTCEDCLREIKYIKSIKL